MTADGTASRRPADTPPGHSFMINFEDMSEQECRALLAEESVGRVGWTSPTGVFILPVSYIVRGDRIAFRTSPYGTLAQLIRPTAVAFQVDELDRPHRAGRSVLVQGVTQAAQDSSLEPGWRMDGPTPWATGTTRNLLIEIRIRHIAGRVFHARR